MKTFAFIWLEGKECQAGGYFTAACKAASSFPFWVSLSGSPLALRQCAVAEGKFRNKMQQAIESC